MFHWGQFQERKLRFFQRDFNSEGSLHTCLFFQSLQTYKGINVDQPTPRLRVFVPSCSHLLQLSASSVILSHDGGGEKAAPETCSLKSQHQRHVPSACHWDVDPTHTPAGGREWVVVRVCSRGGGGR